MRNKLLLTLTLALVITLVSQQPVLAYSSIEFTDPAGNDIGTVTNPFSTCPEPITALDIYVYVTNLGDSADTFEMSLEMPNGWNGQIQSDIMLDSGERDNLDLFLINIPNDADPGVYEVTVTATSMSDPSDVESETLYIEILSCHVVEVNIADAYEEICEEDDASVTYSIDITNRGRWTETFDLSASVSWASFSTNSVNLGPDETETVTLTLTPPEDLIGVQNVLVTAESTSSYAEDAVTVQLNIKNCYDFSLNLQPTENTVCLGRSADYTLRINNVGLEPDTYTLSAPSWVSLETNTITVGVNQEEEVGVTVTPEQTGSLEFTIEVVSENEAGLEKNVTGVVNSNECRGVAVIVFPSQTTVCSGIPVEYTVSVKNTGTIAETFGLTASMGVLEQDTVMLEPGETREVTLTVDTSELSGTEIITITASSDTISDQVETELVLENCYSATITITPDNQSACPYSRINYTIIVENTGELSDSYTLEFEELMQEFYLESETSKTFTFPVFSDTSGAYLITARIYSDHISVSDDATLLITPLDICYSVELTAEEETTTTETNKAIAIPIAVKNMGERPDTYDLSISGPEWVYLSPTMIELEPGQTVNAYIYVSPPFGTPAGAYTITVDANSLYSQSSIEIETNVISDVTAPPEEPEENVTTGEENVTVGEEENVTGDEENITLVINDTGRVVIDTTPDNVTGLFLGDDEERPLWKTLTVAVITVIIIIILIVRFAFLWKK